MHLLLVTIFAICICIALSCIAYFVFGDAQVSQYSTITGSNHINATQTPQVNYMAPTNSLTIEEDYKRNSQKGITTELSETTVSLLSENHLISNSTDSFNNMITTGNTIEVSTQKITDSTIPVASTQPETFFDSSTQSNTGFSETMLKIVTNIHDKAYYPNISDLSTAATKNPDEITTTNLNNIHETSEPEKTTNLLNVQLSSESIMTSLFSTDKTNPNFSDLSTNEQSSFSSVKMPPGVTSTTEVNLQTQKITSSDSGYSSEPQNNNIVFTESFHNTTPANEISLTQTLSSVKNQTLPTQSTEENSLLLTTNKNENSMASVLHGETSSSFDPYRDATNENAENMTTNSNINNGLSSSQPSIFVSSTEIPDLPKYINASDLYPIHDNCRYPLFFNSSKVDFSFFSNYQKNLVNRFGIDFFNPLKNFSAQLNGMNSPYFNLNIDMPVLSRPNVTKFEVSTMDVHTNRQNSDWRVHLENIGHTHDYISKLNCFVISFYGLNPGNIIDDTLKRTTSYVHSKDNVLNVTTSFEEIHFFESIFGSPELLLFDFVKFKTKDDVVTATRRNNTVVESEIKTFTNAEKNKIINDCQKNHKTIINETSKSFEEKNIIKFIDNVKDEEGFRKDSRVLGFTITEKSIITRNGNNSQEISVRNYLLKSEDVDFRENVTDMQSFFAILRETRHNSKSFNITVIGKGNNSTILVSDKITVTRTNTSMIENKTIFELPANKEYNSTYKSSIESVENLFKITFVSDMPNYEWVSTKTSRVLNVHDEKKKENQNVLYKKNTVAIEMNKCRNGTTVQHQQDQTEVNERDHYVENTGRSITGENSKKETLIKEKIQKTGDRI